MIDFRPCGRPGCRLCAHNQAGKPPDSGHSTEDGPLTLFLVGLVWIVLFVGLFVLLPVVAR